MTAQKPHDLAFLGESPLLVFGKNQTAIRADIKNSAGTGNQLHVDAAEFPLQLSLQTGGTGLVVSRSAVGNGDFHCSSSLVNR